MMPLLFGDGTAPRYGAYHAPAGRSGSCAVVLANPFGHEAMRAHRAYRQLATALARDGWPVFRFDYAGTGDSAGETPPGSLAVLADDVALAADEVRDLSGVRRVVLAGLRIGADAALLAAAGRRDVRGVVCWDPIADGASFSSALPVQRGLHGVAVGGFACSETLLEEWRQIGSAATPSVPKRITAVVGTHARATLDSRMGAWRAAGAVVDCVTTEDSLDWAAADDEGSIVLPAEALRTVSAAIVALAQSDGK